MAAPSSASQIEALSVDPFASYETKCYRVGERSTFSLVEEVCAMLERGSRPALTMTVP